MLEPCFVEKSSKPYSEERREYDVNELEFLCKLCIEKGISKSNSIQSQFYILVSLIGTKEFLIEFSKLQEYVFDYQQEIQNYEF